MGTTDKKEYINIQPLNDGENDLVVRDLTLTRPDNGEPLFSNLNLTLKKGERLVITGASGSGKSTLIKAIRDLWETGTGRIEKPSDDKIMTVSQKAFIPDASVHGIVNYPKPMHTFSNKEVADALRSVGHDRLVQYVKGEQINFIIDEIIADLPPHKGEVTDESLAAWAAPVYAALTETIEDHLDICQFMLPEQVDYLATKLLEKSGIDFARSDDGDMNEFYNLTSDIVDKMNDAMSQKLFAKLANDIPQLIAETTGTDGGLPALQREFYITYLLKQVRSQLHEMQRLRLHGKREGVQGAIKNLIDKARGPAEYDPDNEIQKARQINADQIDSIAERLTDQIAEGINAGPDWSLTGTFNRFSPLRRKKLKRYARQIAGHFSNAAKFTLTSQVATGKNLSKRLSGGEQQKLIFARAVLHKPDILIMDEVTSALDPKAGDDLYQMVLKALPDTTIISVAHKENVRQYHHRHAELIVDPEDSDNNRFEIHPIENKFEPPAAPTPAP